MASAASRVPASPAELEARLAAERRGEPFVLYRDADGTQRIVLLVADAPRVTVGRRADSDVALEWDDRVSRLHAVLERVGRQWTLNDDGLSRNGSFVNGARLLGRRRLRDGDALRLGSTLLEFRDPVGGESHATSAGDEPLADVELTRAQRAVLVALCRPFAGGSSFARPASNHDIAEELSYSVDGVKTHLRALFRKLGVGDLGHNEKRLDLVERAVRGGLVNPREFREPPG